MIVVYTVCLWKPEQITMKFFSRLFSLYSIKTEKETLIHVDKQHPDRSAKKLKVTQALNLSRASLPYLYKKLEQAGI